MFDPELVRPERIRKLSRREYDQLVELGAFEDEPIELLRGMLVTMSPQGVPHNAVTAWLVQKLCSLLGMAYDIRAHSPYAATDDSEPEPDVCVQRADWSVLAHHTHPLLVIEVANSSVRKDRTFKGPLYAEAGVPEYWLVNVSKDDLTIEVHTDPTREGYRTVEVLRDGDVLRPTKLPLELPVIEIPWNR